MSVALAEVPRYDAVNGADGDGIYLDVVRIDDQRRLGCDTEADL